MGSIFHGEFFFGERILRGGGRNFLGGVVWGGGVIVRVGNFLG